MRTEFIFRLSRSRNGSSANSVGYSKKPDISLAKPSRVNKINRTFCNHLFRYKCSTDPFLSKDEPLKTHVTYLSISLVLLVVACWGWFRFLGAQMVGRGDVREASYLASEFTAFCIQNNRLPTAVEASGFSTRLVFVELRNGQYLYKCGHFARDSLTIERDIHGRFQFWVVVSAFK